MSLRQCYALRRDLSRPSRPQRCVPNRAIFIGFRPGDTGDCKSHSRSMPERAPRHRARDGFAYGSVTLDQRRRHYYLYLLSVADEASKELSPASAGFRNCAASSVSASMTFSLLQPAWITNLLAGADTLRQVRFFLRGLASSSSPSMASRLISDSARLVSFASVAFSSSSVSPRSSATSVIPSFSAQALRVP
jgi:hypothetical protein